MLAELFNDKKIIRELNEALEERFKEKKKLSGKEVVKSLSKITNDIGVSKSIIYLLMEKKILIKRKIGGEIEFYQFEINLENMKEYISSQLLAIDNVKQELKEKPKQDTGKFEILATYPEDAEYKEVEGIKRILPALKRSIRETKNEILITNPYFDVVAVLQLIDELIEAAERGVAIKIISREIFESNESNKKDKESLLRLYKRFEQQKLLKQLYLRDYHKLNKKTNRQEASVHSKLFLFDNKKSYIGSANITYPSFHYNFELGVIIEKDNLDNLRTAFYNLWDISKRISKKDLT